jgi:hypothetical protein
MKKCIFLFINCFTIGFMSLTAGLCQTVTTIKMIRLVLAALLLITIFSGTSRAQCTGSTTIFSDDFGTNGDGTNCESLVSASNMSSQMGFDDLNPGGGCQYPSDGDYSLVCNSAEVGCQFLWHDTFSDQTPSDVNGNMVIINDGANTEFYRNSITVCPSKTYTVTFYLANLADADVTGACGGAPLIPNIEASAYPTVGGTTGGTTTSYGSLIAASNLTWTTYTFTFTTAAGQTTADIVLKDLAAGGCGNDIAFDGFSVVGPPPGATPVTLINFNASKESDIIKLTWLTATEINNDYFTVEKSKNGVDFTNVDIVDGAGNSQSTLNYQTTDHSPYNGISYYRLKQVDYDGTVSYSKIVAVNFKDNKNITVYPNPGTGIFNIQGLGTESEITVRNPLGQTILIKRTFSDSSEIDLRDQLSGVYYIKINNGDTSISAKIILNR